MSFTGINNEDQLVQRTFAEHLGGRLGWEKDCGSNRERVS